MEETIRYADKNFPNFVENLKHLVRIPSVSFPGFPKEHVEESAEAVAEHLRKEGLEHVELLRVGDAHPYVYGDWLNAPGKPTVLLYAHHDVQPPGREEVWKTPPFEPVEKDGRLYGRGAADDKAGIIVHTSTIHSYLKTAGKLPLNVKVLIEGEEEIGSENLEPFLTRYKDKLKADVIILTDLSNYDVGVPAITTSLRGLVAVEVEAKVMKTPLHSGMWGGPVPDPVIALSKIIAKLVDADGKIAIPGIYDDVSEPTAEELASLKSLNFTEAEYRKQAGILSQVKLIGGDAPPLKKMWRLPSISVNAIQASSRKSPANIINEAAWCKIGIRTVPNMDAKKTQQQLVNFLKENAPWGVQIDIKAEAVAPWWSTKPVGKLYDEARAALTKAYGKECVYTGCGGTIPFVTPFSRVLGGVPILVGVEDPYTNAHAENESVHLGDLKSAIRAGINLFQVLSEMA